MNNYIIYISKKRSPDDKYGIAWGQIETLEYDEEKAKAKFDMLRILFGENFILHMTMRVDK